MCESKNGEQRARSEGEEQRKSCRERERERRNEQDRYEVCHKMKCNQNFRLGLKVNERHLLKTNVSVKFSP